MSDKYDTVLITLKKYSLFNSINVGGDVFVDSDLFCVDELGCIWGYSELICRPTIYIIPIVLQLTITVETTAYKFTYVLVYWVYKLVGICKLCEYIIF